MPRIVVLGLILASLVAVQAWGLETTIKELVSSPERFDGQSVSLRGTIANVERRVSGKGNPYFTLTLSDGTNTVRVFSFGDTPCQSGSAGTVDGRFDRTKKVGRYTFRNEVTATRVTCP